MKGHLKTVALLVAALIYVPLVIDWLMPGSGLHLATVALGGYGSDALRPLSDLFLWDLLVRLIGWDLRGLGTLSMFWALVSLGLIAYSADRATRGVSPLSTGLVCAAFVVTPGFLRAATRPDPLMVILAVLLLGFAPLVWLLTKSGHETTAKRVLRRWWLTLCSLLLLVYGLLNFICLELSTLAEDSLHLLWFVLLGVLPYLVLVKRLKRHSASRRFKVWFLGIWITAITISAVVAARSFDVGRASGRLAEQLISNAGRDPSIANDPALSDVYLWTLPSDRRNEIIDWISRDGRRVQPDIERCFPTKDLWHTSWMSFVAMDRREPLWDHYRELFRTCGNRLGEHLLDSGDSKGAWIVYWEVLNGVDGECGVTILNLCGLIERGYEADPASREFLGRRLLRMFRELKTSGRLTGEEVKAAETMQRTIRASVSNKLIRPDQIGQKLLDLDLLLGDWESAERDAMRILSLDRRNVRALSVMGKVCGRRGGYAESERYLRRALETGRADRSVTGDLAFTLVCMGHAKDAVPLARSLVRTEPGNWSFRETLALALIRSGELEEGGRELKAAANLAQRAKVPSRDQIRLAVDRAWLFRKQGDEENLKKTLRVLENLKELEQGLRMEIEEIVAHPAKAQI